MDEDASMTFTSLALIILLIIMIVMFVCHFLAPRATTWMRSNKEEKIGLSKNKLFHANGYMLHSGSDFLLSTSGSFKRFDTIEKEDHKRSGQHPMQRTTTPLWHLPQTDCDIPPQPLRPAPAPKNAPNSPSPFNSAGPNKTVTFSFSNINETDSAESEAYIHDADDSDGHSSNRTGTSLASCLRASNKTSPIPQPIDAPPPPRTSSSVSASLSAVAIPRPVTKRQVLIQNGKINDANASVCSDLAITPNGKSLVRRNSSTNPFLCESFERFPQTKSAPNNALLNDLEKLQDTQSNKHNHNNHKFSSSPPLGSTCNLQNDTANGAQCNGHDNIVNPFFEGDMGTSLSGEPNSVAHNNGCDPKGPFNHHAANAKVFNLKAPINETGSKPSTTPSVISNLNEQHYRNRSFSETEASESDLKTFSTKIAKAGLNKIANSTNPFTGLTQRVKGPHMLQKTISEDFLFRKLGRNYTNNMGEHTNSAGHVTTWSFGHPFGISLDRRNSSQCSLDSIGAGSIDSINLERAISCDSVNSESSVFLTDLDQPYTQITGYLCIGLHYDKNYITDEGLELTVTVVAAKELLCPFNVESLDTFVRIYLVPDHAGAMQTKIVKNSQTPNYNESFNFWIKKHQGRHSLWFHLYHSGLAHTLIGEAEMEIGEVPRPITTWIPLSDSRKTNAKWGELMFSLSYLPTAERLTIVVVKARNLKLDIHTSNEPETVTQEAQNIFVKVYLMNNDKKVLKKRTSLKRKDRSPVFNESMIFSIPPASLTTVQLRLTVFGIMADGSITALEPLGHVIAGSCATGKGLRHWHQMLSSLRKPVAMWHVLRRAANQPVFTGGAEAVVAAMQNAALLRSKRNSII